MEHPKRSFIKAITWRTIALVTTIIVVYAYSGDIKESLVVGLSANAIKLLLYYAHERMWNRVQFGRIKHPEYQI